MSDDFNWREDPEIVVREQPALAVYRGARDHVVIRQEASWDEDEDRCIFVLPQNAVRVARAILAAAGLEWPAPQMRHEHEAQPQSDEDEARKVKARNKKRRQRGAGKIVPLTEGTCPPEGGDRGGHVPRVPGDSHELFAFDALAPLHEREGTAG